ncbi:MAG: MarC family protein [Bacteroidaceae bacterium]|nr:MarC family protein [Bacteroidaceae bacterium]MBQ8008699.1 MarC family protein [Bacteroidaceae bacterium]MBR1541503.1 MarC family protein [Bacteroidaceae bacterium]
MLSKFDYLEVIRCFISLMIVIDIIGSIPIILDLKAKGMNVNATKATVLASLFMLGFFYVGDLILKLFSVDIQSFAIAGAFILFFMALEMILDVTIFKNTGPTKDATLVPLVFPLLAGSASFTTLLALRAEAWDINILIALVLNMIWVFVVLKMADRVERFFGKSGIYIIRKFFGIILLAIAVRMFTANLSLLIEQLSK